MAENSVSDEEMALRRRARRRLVGAVALALTAIVVLPMLFDPKPKPLGSDVDVQIPAQDAAFVSSQAAPAAVTQPPPSAAAPEPTGSMLDPVESMPAAKLVPPPPMAKTAEPTLSETPSVSTRKAVPDKPVTPVKETAKPVQEKKVEAVPSQPAPTGYFLQLGLFDKQVNAKKMIDQARTAGFKARSSEEKDRWRVLVGPVTERSKALEYQTKLKAKGLDSVLVSP